MSLLGSQGPEYAVRAFEDDDLAGFLNLHSRIFDPDYGREWFEWKYRANPYVDHVPIFVATADGEIVGARPFFALEMSVGGQRELALQPGDTMVHPEHRRQGLFTRMNEAAIEQYQAGDPSFFFNFPNEQSGPGYLKLGWETVGEISTYYRIQDPSALGFDSATARGSIVKAALKPLLDGYNQLSDALTGTADEVTVTKHDAIPSETLADLAESHSDPNIHVLRDQQFYDWRFDTPAWEYTAYTASVGGDEVAGMVAGTAYENGLKTTKVTDVVPAPDGTRTMELAALVQQVVRDHDGSDILAAPSSLAHPVLDRWGFRRDDTPPLGRAATQTTHVVRSVTDDWRINGVDISDESNWRLTFSEQDTS